MRYRGERDTKLSTANVAASPLAQFKERSMGLSAGLCPINEWGAGWASAGWASALGGALDRGPLRCRIP